jgi:hypothetical protein
LRIGLVDSGRGGDDDGVVPDRVPEQVEAAASIPASRASQSAALEPGSLTSAILALQRSVGNRAATSVLRSRRLLARAPALPGFSQRGDTCGAASLVTALFLWDIERSSPDNRAVVHACDLVLTDRDVAGANPVAKAAVSSVRALAMTLGHTLGQLEYEALSSALALLYNGRAGMSSSEISTLATGLGFRPSAQGSGNTLGEILATDAVRNLKPGEVGQLNWIIAATGGGHAMLLGRNEDGTWFFSDQGQSPPKQIQTGTHPALVSAILMYASIGGWLYNGNKLDLQSIPPVVGFVVMSGIQGFLNRGPSLITPGERLAEVDAGPLTTGEVITAWDYFGRFDSLAVAKDAIGKDTGANGGVIVERPRGMFHIYKTNPVTHKDNLKVTDIDKDDSADMVLVRRIKTFYSVWVVLADPSGTKSSPFEVKP